VKIPREVREHLAKVGKKGGKNGKGKPKNRVSEHYAKLGAIGGKASGPRKARPASHTRKMVEIRLANQRKRL
jgi:general stress protein YciG